MVNHFSVDRVAGECTNKGFVEFQENGWTLEDGKTYNVYCYYYGDRISNKSKVHYEGSYPDRNKIDDMSERITPVNEFEYIHFSIKKKEHYDAFIEYIKSHSTESITGDKRILDYHHYVLNNAVFIDCNYLRGFSSYCVYIYPLSKFTAGAKANTDSSANKKLTLSKDDSSHNDKLQGLWKGRYNEKNISLAILNIANDTVYGYSSVNGNFAPFTGNITSGNSGYNLELIEKQERLNGIFHLSFDSTENTMSGKWASYDGALKGELKLSRAVQGDSIKIIADKAYIFADHEYKTQSKGYYNNGDFLQYDSFSTIFIHFTDHSNYNQNTGWLLIKKVVFQN